MIKYIGSKRLLLGSLVDVLRSVPELTSIADLFSGTARCGHAFKRAGYQVTSNDHNTYAHTLATCYVQADRERVVDRAATLLRELNALPGRPGYFTDTFCVRSRFFQPHNGERVDAIRERIEGLGLDPVLKSVVLVSLMEAADRVDSTCGLQMAYVKQWAPRAYNRLELRMPDVLPSISAGQCRALCMDANDAAEQLESDVAYIDPPYNQHSYLCNYHIWESLVLWDKPEVYGVACKRVDCRTRKSQYNSKRLHRAVFEDMVRKLRASLLVVSFNDEGFQSRPEMEALLAERGRVFVVTKDFKRYVGAQIGIHSPTGDLVGNVSHLRNEEYIYLVATPALTRRVPDVLGRLERVARRVTDSGPKEQTTLSAFSAAAANEIRPRMDIVRIALSRGAATVAELLDRTKLSDYQLRTALATMSGRGEVARVGGGRAGRYCLAESTGLVGDASVLESPTALERGVEVRRVAPRAAGTPVPDAARLRDLVLTTLRARGQLRSEELQEVLLVPTTVLRAVLADLVERGAVVRSGRARGTRYAAAVLRERSEKLPSGKVRPAASAMGGRQLSLNI